MPVVSRMEYFDDAELNLDEKSSGNLSKSCP
jgi:hypothetical protein